MTHTLPPGWEEKKLEDIVSVLNGLWTGKKPPYCQAFVIRSTNFTKDCRLDLADVANLQVEQRQFDNRELKKGDILVEKSGGGPKQPVGRVVLFDKTERGFSFSNFTSVLRIKNPTIISYYFLYWLLYFCYLSGKTIPMQKYTTGIRNLQMSEYKELKVSLPSLVEQKRIVEKLDKIFATIDEAKQNIEKNLDNVKELFQRTLSHLFTHNTQGWEDKPLPDVCIFQSGTTIEKKYEKEKGDLLYVKVGDMNLPDNTFKINTSSRFALSSDISAKQILPIGAVIFPKRGGAIATNKKRQIVKPTIVDLNTMSIKCVEDIDDDFFFLWFQQIDLLSISNGTTIPQINNYSFKDLRIKYPHNIYEQKKIVNKLRILQEKVAQAQVSYTQKLADLEELKQAVLQQAFSGKL